MKFVKLTPGNLETEHICCAIASRRDPQAASKKEWLRGRLDEGLVFLKSEERGKCLIEYLPAEAAWVPVEAGNYMHINCFWVSGSLKGHGYANDLLAACIRDSREKGRCGVTVISSPQKQPYLSDPKYLAYKGFQVADTAEPFFTLLYLPFLPDAPVPRFLPQVRSPRIDEPGFVLYYTHGCPFTAKYVPLIEEAAKEAGIPFKSHLIENCAAAKRAPAAWTNYALFYDGAFVTHEILSVKKFLALAGSRNAKS